MRGEQKMFELTGSLHAAAIVAPDGILQVVREDVGRHNAVDKVIGSAFLSGELSAHRSHVGGERSGFLRDRRQSAQGVHGGDCRGIGTDHAGGGSGAGPWFGAGRLHPRRPTECICWGRLRRAMSTHVIQNGI
jgi:hypothetical protein